MQRTDQGITLSKNANYTQPSTSGNAITAWLYPEDSYHAMTSGTDVTVGTPTGVAADTDLFLQIDTLTGITLTKRIERFALHVVDDSGNQLIPNRALGDAVFIDLQKVPS